MTLFAGCAGRKRRDFKWRDIRSQTVTWDMWTADTCCLPGKMNMRNGSPRKTARPACRSVWNDTLGSDPNVSFWDFDNTVGNRNDTKGSDPNVLWPQCVTRKNRKAWISSFPVSFWIVDRGIEPLFPPWEGGVLTAWPIDRIRTWVYYNRSGENASLFYK